jgi:hypothetical protein
MLHLFEEKMNISYPNNSTEYAAKKIELLG